jgi:hypothetical protein
MRSLKAEKPKDDYSQKGKKIKIKIKSPLNTIIFYFGPKYKTKIL